MKNTILLLLLLLISSGIYAQSYAFGVKGGVTAGLQTWDNYGRDPLYNLHGILFIESADDDKGSVFAQIGHHTKGSANRPRNSVVYQDIQGNQVNFKPTTIEYEFYNISLTAGFKKKYPFGKNFGYYMLGLRGDYCYDTNFEQFSQLNKYFFFYPDEAFLRRWNYGMTVGGGFEFPFSELVGGVLQFTVNPDFSKTYIQPPIANIINTLSPGQTYSLPERRISNVTLEITLGFRFLRKIIYVDELIP